MPTEIFRNPQDFYVTVEGHYNVQSWGGGAKGGESSNGEGGGGGGAYAESNLVLPVGRYTIEVGNGGGAPTGLDGQASGFRVYPENQPPGEYLNKAVGGKAAQGRTGGLGGDASQCIGDICYSGGNGGSSIGPNAGGGGGGSSAGSNSNGNNGQMNSGPTGGLGGTAPVGGGPGNNGANNGQDATSITPDQYEIYFSGGGGGGGKGGNSAGGNVGKVVIEW